MASNEYVLTEDIKIKLEGKGKNLTCVCCDKPIEAGQEIHKSSGKGKYYHKKCFRKLLR